MAQSLLSAEDFGHTLMWLAHHLVELFDDLDILTIFGMQTRGADISRHIQLERQEEAQNLVTIGLAARMTSLYLLSSRRRE